MGRAGRTKQNATRRERVAAQRAAQRRRQVRNRVLLIFQLKDASSPVAQAIDGTAHRITAAICT